MTASEHRHIRATISTDTAPVLAEVWRGNLIESRHRAIVAVIDPEGRVVHAWGDIEQPIYGRSAIKPLLAIPLVESGAADRYGLSNVEIALATASHNGEPGHTETVRAWLAKVGLSADDLECGPHLPYHEPTMKALVRSGQEPDRAVNNCSGKHSGFLTTAVHLSEPTRGYIRYEHPVQQRLLGVLEQMCGLDLGNVPRGVDGCGIPTIAIPIGNHALAMAKMADSAHLSEARGAACRRILAAMTAEPWHVAGTGRFCTDVMKVLGPKAAIKTGAEGVYCGALPELGLGICIKALDGAGRAAEVIMGAVLKHLGVIDEAEAVTLADKLQPPIRNWAGTVTGSVKMAEGSGF